MAFELAFVDGINSSPNIRLNLNDGQQITTMADGTDFGMPDLDRAIASTLLDHGAIVPAAAYTTRLITLELNITTASMDADAAVIQAISRELDRTQNFLRYKPETSNPVFFRTFRSPASRVWFDKIQQRHYATVLAEPFAYGEKQTLSTATVYNDPAEGNTANTNPYFETNASGWTGVGAASFVRSTAQFHEGAASGLLTPDGVSTESRVESTPSVAVTASQSVRVSAWLRCAVSRSVTLRVRWHDAADAFLSASSEVTTISVTANTWTYFDVTAVAPANAAGARLDAVMFSTPPGSNLLYIDEARLRLAGGAGAMCFELSGVKGDVETPLFLSLPYDDINAFRDAFGSTGVTSCVAVRRRGTPSRAPFVLQAEKGTVQVGTAVGTGDTAMSGGSYMRTTPTGSTMQSRISFDNTWVAASPDVRGQYRVLVRTRHSTGGDVFQVRMSWTTTVGGSNSAFNSSATLAVDSGSGSGTKIHYADLGLISFPFGGDPVQDGYSGAELSARPGYQIWIDAARVSGSGTVDFDALLFIPADDRLALVTWPLTSLTGGTYVLDSANSITCRLASTGELSSELAAAPVGGTPLVSPSVTNRVYFVPSVTTTANGFGSDSLTATVRVTPYYWPRYLTVARPVSS